MARRLNVSHSHKFILWAPPRCGARYTAGVLSQLGLRGGEERNQGRVRVVTHAIDDPPPGYASVLLVRNPFTRLLSNWSWVTQGKSQEDFAGWAWENRRRWLVSVSRLVRGKQVDHVVHLENLAAELRSLPFCDRDLHFPKNAFKSDYHQQGRQWYSYELQMLVAEVYRDDFFAFGYDPGEIF